MTRRRCADTTISIDPAERTHAPFFTEVICASGGGEPQSFLVSLAGLVGGVLEAFLALRVSRAFGHGVLFALGLLLAQPLFVLYLGFGPDRYRRLAWSF